MERKTLLIFLGIAVFIVTLVITVIVTAAEQSQPESLSPSESCKVLQYTDPASFNLLFFASKDQAEQYRAYLFNEPPYTEYKNNFNVYYIDTFDVEESCTRYKNIATLCYSDTLLKAASACPHTTIVAIVDEEREIRSSAYKNVISLNKNHPAQEVLRHELGHIYGLGEEYVPAPLVSRQKNCQKSCDQFLTTGAGCFEGCSDASFFRSIENGVMRTLDNSNYGSFNEQLIRERIQSITDKTAKSLTGNAVSTSSPCSEQTFNLLEVETSSSQWAIESQQKVQGCPSTVVDEPYRFAILDSSGNVQLEGTFDDSLLFTDAPGSTGDIEGEVYQETRFYVEVPDVPGAQSVVLYDEENNLRAQTLLSNGGATLCKVL